MYETIEIYNENGNDLKAILKSCIYNYYNKNKEKFNIDKIAKETIKKENGTKEIS